MSSSTRHLFLSGCQRSGKTLLQLILGSHPVITISPGAKTIQALLLRFPHDRPLRPDEVEKIRRISRKDRKLRAWRIDLDPFDRSLDEGSPLRARDLADVLMREFRDQTKPEALYVGNKKGWYSKSGDVAKRLFPEAKLVLLMRDGRGAAASMIAHQGHTPRSAAIVWQAKASRIRQIARAFPDDVAIVRYERLVSDPEQTCRELCRFLDVEYADEMLRDYRHNDALRHRTDLSHPQTYQAITTALVDRWRGQLDDDDLFTIEAIAGLELRAYGYPLEHPEALHSWRRLQSMPEVFADYWSWWTKRVEHLRNLGDL